MDSYTNFSDGLDLSPPSQGTIDPRDLSYPSNGANSRDVHHSFAEQLGDASQSSFGGFNDGNNNAMSTLNSGVDVNTPTPIYPPRTQQYYPHASGLAGQYALDPALVSGFDGRIGGPVLAVPSNSMFPSQYPLLQAHPMAQNHAQPQQQMYFPQYSSQPNRINAASPMPPLQIPQPGFSPQPRQTSEAPAMQSVETQQLSESPEPSQSTYSFDASQTSENSPSTPSVSGDSPLGKRKRGRKPRAKGTDEEEKARHAEFLERNRRAAAKCRQNSRFKQERTLEELERLQSENTALHETAQSLQEEISQLKALLAPNAAYPAPIISPSNGAESNIDPALQTATASALENGTTMQRAPSADSGVGLSPRTPASKPGSPQNGGLPTSSPVPGSGLSPMAGFQQSQQLAYRQRQEVDARQHGMKLRGNDKIGQEPEEQQPADINKE